MSNAIIVQKLIVYVETGEAQDDPYGQGFSAIYAEATVQKNDLLKQLANTKKKNEVITLRCAMLEITGYITKVLPDKKLILSVENVIYHKPKQPWEK
jgi:hypothetical protein